MSTMSTYNVLKAVAIDHDKSWPPATAFVSTTKPQMTVVGEPAYVMDLIRKARKKGIEGIMVNIYE